MTLQHRSFLFPASDKVCPDFTSRNKQFHSLLKSALNPGQWRPREHKITHPFFFCSHNKTSQTYRPPQLRHKHNSSNLRTKDCSELSDLHQNFCIPRRRPCICVKARFHRRQIRELRKVCGRRLSGACARTRGTLTSAFLEAAAEACSRFSQVAEE